MERERLAETLGAAEKDIQSKGDMEKKLFEYFGSLVSEWNPSRDDEGVPRHFWDEEMQAYDWELPVEAVGESLWTLMKDQWVDTKNRIRVRLRNVLDAVFEAEARGEQVDLHPLRRLVTLLVETCQRHTKHSNGALNPPVLGKDPCARQGDKGAYCRYNYPKKPKFPRGDERPMILQKMEGREGSWEAKFPLNDVIVCSYEPHVLLGNLGNVDWRPVVNLWSVIEYITKYATKAQKGSRAMGEVLRDAAEEVCKYNKEDRMASRISCGGAFRSALLGLSESGTSACSKLFTWV